MLWLGVSDGAFSQTPLTTERVASGLSQPLFVTAPAGDVARLFVVEQAGRIQILDLTVDPPQLEPTPFLDITGRVNSLGNERGLLGLAFHPNFAQNRFFYVNYTGSGGTTHVSRFEVPVGTPQLADATSEVVLLQVSQPQSNHNGGWIGFGPTDGLLYIATGDGGGANDTGSGHTSGTGNSQDITGNLLGKMLRIDVDGNDGPGGNYGIPPGNPFVGVTGDDEIWSFGLRNPWRNAFDALTGDLYIADVGQNTWEEVDFQAVSSSGGENWGWRCREGAHDFNTGGNCSSATLLDPVHEYSHFTPPFGCSITGGEVYRGCAIPDLAGSYFFSDFCSAQIWTIRVSGGVATALTERTAELAPPGLSIDSVSSFGTDALGEVYIVDRGGEVFKIIPDGVESQCVQASFPALRLWPMVLTGLGMLAVFYGLGQRRARLGLS
ncbi:MAG: PQQ-dependent sugar dehydrogenase [Myxococcota bacterium]|nr:PQQ-dependent sugar dehydrogenase [Myxococcota bacterium]